MLLTDWNFNNRSYHCFNKWFVSKMISKYFLIYILLDLKHLELLMIGFLVPFLVVAFVIDESPRWLLSKGQTKEAKRIVQKMLKMNKLPPENIEKLQISENKAEKGSLLDILKRRGMRRNQLLLCVYWLGCSMATYGLNFYTPAFDWNPYLVFVFPALLNVPMILITPFLENK